VEDQAVLERLSRAMETRGFTVTSCDSVSDGLAQIGKAAPAFAVVDLRLGDGNGLDVVVGAQAKAPRCARDRADRLWHIATAVTAVKMGAVDYLSKPADADDVVAALLASGNEKVRAAAQSDVGGSGALGAHPAHLRCATATSRKPARRLNMHRRTCSVSGQARAAVNFCFARRRSRQRGAHTPYRLLLRYAVQRLSRNPLPPVVMGPCSQGRRIMCSSGLNFQTAKMSGKGDQVKPEVAICCYLDYRLKAYHRVDLMNDKMALLEAASNPRRATLDDAVSLSKLFGFGFCGRSPV